MTWKPWIAALALVLPAAPGPLAAFETAGSTAMVVDHATGLTLYAKNADEPLPPASMSKLMTLYMLFEAIRDGKVTPETEFIVSREAQAMGGSRMFVEAGKQGLGRRPDPRHHRPVRQRRLRRGRRGPLRHRGGLRRRDDQARARTRHDRDDAEERVRLARARPRDERRRISSRSPRLIIDEFPEYYAIFDEREFTYNGITQQNRNPLLGLGLGVDGLKTGHTSEAGYGLVGSAVQNDQRVVFVVSGLDSIDARAAESAAIVQMGVRRVRDRALLRGERDRDRGRGLARRRPIASRS